MGSSRWSSDDWTLYSAKSSSVMADARAKGLDDHSARASYFRQTKIKDYLDPKGIVVRESRDSDANPNSTAIIIGLDVTGSMGSIAEHMATKSLGKLFEGIIDRTPVSDPHIMLMGIGDIFCDRAPLQVSQFEADIRIAEQLTDLWLEGGGGGNAFESYDLPWYFAARKTSIDCFEKRGKKGYLFTIGDEPPPPQQLRVEQLNETFGITEQANIPPGQALTEAQEKYNVFHIIVEEGSYARRAKSEVTSKWRKILGNRAVSLNNYEYLSEVILSVMEVSEGADPQEVINSWENPDIRKTVKYALGL